MWDLSKQRLGTRGWRALQRLLPGTTSLVSLTLPLNPEKDGAPLSLSPASDTAQPFFRTTLPAPLCRAFRAAAVRGATGGLRARRHIAAAHERGRFRPACEPEAWHTLARDEAGAWRLPTAWFEQDAHARPP